MISQSYYDALKVVLSHYREMSKGHQEDELLVFIEEFDQAIDDRLPLMKLNRWMGYLQGILIAHGHTTVQEERDFTRPYFHPLDFE